MLLIEILPVDSYIAVSGSCVFITHIEILPVDLLKIDNSEGILNSLEDIPAAELVEQLFVSLVSTRPIRSHIILSFIF